MEDGSLTSTVPENIEMQKRDKHAEASLLTVGIVSVSLQN